MRCKNHEIKTEKKKNSQKEALREVIKTLSLKDAEIKTGREEQRNKIKKSTSKDQRQSDKNDVVIKN